MKKLYSPKEVASILNVSVRTVKRWQSSGKLKPDMTADNGYTFFSAEQIEELRKDMQGVQTYDKGMTQTYDKGMTSAQTYDKGMTQTYDKGMTSAQTYDKGMTQTYDKGMTQTYDKGVKGVQNLPDVTPLDTKHVIPFNNNVIPLDTKKFFIPENVIDEIKQIPPESLAALGVISVAKKSINGKPTYVCPNCENGTGKDGDGIQPNFVGNAWIYHCFKCNEAFNNIHLLGFYYNLDFHSNFKEICRRACDDFGIYLDSNHQYKNTGNNKLIAFNPRQDFVPQKSPEELALESKEIEMIKSDIAIAQDNLNNLPVDARRGITIETFKIFKAGFISDWTSPKSRINNKNTTPTPRLIIPSGNHYLARLTVPLDSFDEETQKYIQPKQHAGTKFLFNFDSISTDLINIVVEGELDAISIFQATNGKIPVVATSGVSGYVEFVRLVKEKLGNADIKPKFLILFDPDESGRNTATKFQEELNSAKFPAV